MDNLTNVVDRILFTVFPPIEAPGAKEMVWGASIFH